MAQASRLVPGMAAEDGRPSGGRFQRPDAGAPKRHGVNVRRTPDAVHAIRCGGKIAIQGQEHVRCRTA